MDKVYFVKPWTPDEYLGYVGADGRVFAARLGPDEYLGRVMVAEGKILAHRPGAEEQALGKIALDTGKVYRHHFLDFDEYLGRIDSEGRCFTHVTLAPDTQIGKIVTMSSYAHAGGAFLLLLLPYWDKIQAEKRARPSTKPPTPTTRPPLPTTKPPLPTTKPAPPTKPPAKNGE